MREYPWISRQETWNHVFRYRLIVGRVWLSRAWLEGLSLPLSYLQRKGLSPELEMGQSFLRHAESVNELETVEFPGALLGARSPDEFLTEFSKAARIQQGLVLDQILKKESSALPRLKSISFQAGATAGGSFKAISVRGAFLVLNQNAYFSVRPGMAGLLPERITDHRVSWVDLDCPHQDPLVELGPVASSLCDLYVEWRAGFCSALNSGSQGSGLGFRFSRLPQGRCRYLLEAERVGNPG
jgi:hypothetical protein